MTEAEYAHVHGLVHLALALGFIIMATNTWSESRFARGLSIVLGLMAAFDMLTALFIYLDWVLA